MILIPLLLFSLIAYFVFAAPGSSADSVFAPADTSSRILVIDPGHGGADGGAVSYSGALESRINLDIAVKAEQIAAFLGVSCDLTRRSEELNYPESAVTIHQKKVADTEARAAFINGLPKAVLLSIHQNQYHDPTIRGAQVFYAPTAGSLELAQAVQQSLIENLHSGNRRSIARIGENIYLMNHISCLAILVECGFLSNPEEDTLLNQPDYQRKTALGIIAPLISVINSGTNANGETI